jgi:ubiquinone/menaquinone biosynthesis C-methylase UbiE
VGSGAGISAAYVADSFNCKVVGIDLLPGMITSAKRWAIEREAVEKMAFGLGDAQDLPFADNQFDVLLCESVNVFVPDKTKALGEYLRVVRPGGYIGLNEAIWAKEPSMNMAEIIVDATGQHFMPADYWEDLLRDAGLADLVVECYPVNLHDEARNQLALLGLKSYLRVLGRAISLLVTDRDGRTLIKYLSANPRGYFGYMGYGLYAGRKPR